MLSHGGEADGRHEAWHALRGCVTKASSDVSSLWDQKEVSLNTHVVASDRGFRAGKQQSSAKAVNYEEYTVIAPLSEKTQRKPRLQRVSSAIYLRIPFESKCINISIMIV